MKLRLFAAFFLILSSTFILGGYLYSKFVQHERLLLIDSQIETRTDELLRSKSLIKALDDESIDWDSNEIVEQVLGDYRVGFFVLIRDQNGDVILENEVSKRLDINPELDQKWQTFRAREYYVRAHVSPIPKKNYVLQTGYVLKETSSIFFNPRVSLLFVLGTLLGVLIASYLLSTWIFRPLQSISDQIHLTLTNFNAEALESLKNTKALNPTHSFFLARDEAARLFGNLRLLLDRVSDLIKQNTFHASQLAHQIMTPLAIIQTLCDQQQNVPIKSQAVRLSQFVRKYLDWSELNNSIKEQTELYAIGIHDEIKKLADDLGPLAKDRIQITVKQVDTRVLADPIDFQFLIENVLTNALKFSQTTPVQVVIERDQIKISDQGPGIPQSVLDNLGKPFNSGHTGIGDSTGLGLAIVTTIAAKYGWKVIFRSVNPGTEITIQFAGKDSFVPV